jgi:hypothetical protein
MTDKFKLTRSGQLATIYGVKRKVVDPNKIKDKNDNPFPFQGGASYKGEWAENEKSGFGVEVDTDGTKYEGEWRNGKYHGKGTQWIVVKKRTVKQYEGEWANGKMDGVGAFHYSNKDVYRGCFSKNMRSGKGKHEFANGDYYTGEWERDMKNGSGSMYYVNGNVYDGRWMDDEKEGPGRFFYASTRKVYEGEWVNGSPVCGAYREPTDDEVRLFKAANIRMQKYELPEIGLANARGVLDLATTETRMQRAGVRGTASVQAAPIGMSAIGRAEDNFAKIDVDKKGIVPFWTINTILYELGVDLDDEQLEDIRSQLEIDSKQELTFPEICDIANFLNSSLV